MQGNLYYWKMKSNYPTIALVVTTFNSSKALKCMLESILRQEVFPDEIVIADDGSTDDSLKLIDTWRGGDSRV